MKEAIVTEGVITELSTAWKLPENDYKASVIESEKIVIIGGGMAKLSVTWKLSEKSYDVKIIEMDKLRLY